MPYRRRLSITAAVAAMTLLPVTEAHADDPERYREYYSIFTRGEQHIPYHDTTPYVPQGLAYWPELDAMIVSYYDDRGGSARLAILARGSRKVIRYPKLDLALAPDGSAITRNADYTLLANSFMEISGNRMYVGSFHENRAGDAYRYILDATEEPHYDNHSFGVPAQVQGMAITQTHFVWSLSYGRDNDSTLAIDNRDGPIERTVTAPNMSEDLATTPDGELYVVYESAAMKYSDADYQVRTIHHGPLSDLIP
jgi:hypothetical protein